MQKTVAKRIRLSWRRTFACEIKTLNGTHSHDVAVYVRIYVAFKVDIHLIYLGVYTCTPWELFEFFSFHCLGENTEAKC